MKSVSKLVGFAALCAAFSLPLVAADVQPVNLGSAANFAVLGGTSVTCTGSGVTGDIGVAPGTSITGFPPTSTLCTETGTIHAGDAVATLAHHDFVIAYNALKALPCDPANYLTGQELGGKTLAPGVYCFDTTAGLTGNLTLNGPSNGVWVFQIGTGLTTGIGSVVMTGGGQQDNVFWLVGTAATIGTGTAFQGNILAGTAITFTGVGSSLVGRALANAEVTMTGANLSTTGANPSTASSVLPTPPSLLLGSSSNFAVLGGTSVTCTNSAVIGDVGVSPGTSVTGFPPTSALCKQMGTIDAGDAVATLAHTDFVIAYDALKAMPCVPANHLTGQELGGKTLAPGVYCFDTTAGLTGNLTLDGPSNGVWVFQIGTGLTTGAGSVVMTGGGQQGNVYWLVGTAATATGTALQGNILAGTAITFTGSSLVGRALAKAEVTMTGTKIGPLSQ